MKTAVIKFGGSSLCDADGFRRCASMLKNTDRGYFVVVSAPGKRFPDDKKMTDLLMDFANTRSLNTLNEIRGRIDGIIADLSLDIDVSDIFDGIVRRAQSGDTAYVVSRGEYLSALIMSGLTGYRFCDAADLMTFTCGLLDEERTFPRVRDMCAEGPAVVTPGFYGSDGYGNIVLFPRGGGDISGSVIGCGVGADVYINVTDVDGVMSCDPRDSDDFVRLPHLSYSDAEFLSYFGAGVIHYDAVEFAAKYSLPINIVSLSGSQGGTLIDGNSDAFTGIVAASRTSSLPFDAVLRYGVEALYGRKAFIGTVADMSDGKTLSLLSDAIGRAGIRHFSACDSMRHCVIAVDEGDCRDIYYNIAKLTTTPDSSKIYTFV